MYHSSGKSSIAFCGKIEGANFNAFNCIVSISVICGVILLARSSNILDINL